MENEFLILRKLLSGSKTANETIDSIYREDIKNGLKRAGWKFYNHLNKRFAPLLKQGLIAVTNHKTGPSNKIEKVWMLTELGINQVEYLMNKSA